MIDYRCYEDFMPMGKVFQLNAAQKKDLSTLIDRSLILVGAKGFEPSTPTTPLWCATKLRYAPKTVDSTASLFEAQTISQLQAQKSA